MQVLRVDTAAVPAMATRWAASAGELSTGAAPAAGLAPSCQASAAAVNAAHLDVEAFTASLAARVRTHSANVGVANAGYLGNETQAADEMAAVASRVIGV